MPENAFPDERPPVMTPCVIPDGGAIAALTTGGSRGAVRPRARGSTLRGMLAPALVALLLFAAPSHDGWTSYVNERFGYSVEVPPGLAGQGEAQNGDGQAFQDASGQAQLKVWGSLVVDLGGGAENRTDLAWTRRVTLEDWRKQGVRVTYQPQGQGWWVLSGETPRGRVLYRKQWEKLGIVYGLEWSHPKGARGWQDATERIVRGFKRP